MRNIKFRAWSELQNKMYYDTQNIYEYLVYECLGDVLVDENLILMQYTNFVDTKGHQIYEGDIVEVNGTRCVIIFDDDTMGYTPLEYNNEFKYIYDSYYEIQKIGNIFENPELFSKNEKLIEKVIDMIYEVM